MASKEPRCLLIGPGAHCLMRGSRYEFCEESEELKQEASSASYDQREASIGEATTATFYITVQEHHFEWTRRRPRSDAGSLDRRVYDRNGFPCRRGRCI